MRALISAWDQFWFAPLDPRVPAALRIGYGLLGLWSYAALWPTLAWSLADGGLGLGVGKSGPDVVNLLANPLWSITTLGEVQAAFLVWMACFVALVLGVGGRLPMLGAWLGIVTLGERNPLLIDGSDGVLRVLGLWMLFLPLNAVWSVGRPDPNAATVEHTRWPLRMMQLQVCIIYVKTGLIKALYPSWQEGTAVFYAMASPKYWRFPMEEILANPAFQGFTVLATYATLVFELGFPLVFVPRLRRLWLTLGLGLHLGVFAFLSLGAFSEVILWSYLAFVVFPPSRRPSP